MADFTFKANGSVLENRYVTYSELGLTPPPYTPGYLYSWGSNNDGALGLGDDLDRSSPVQVGSLTNWSQVSAGLYYSLAVKTDGTLWAWGKNQINGQLGLGDNTNRSSPVQVGSLTNWYQVAAADKHSLAIKTDGTLWSWGDNELGELGLGDTTHRSSPVQVGSLTNWSQVSADSNHSLAIKTDGTLWSWGRNSSGQLGLGDDLGRSSPVQVGSLTNWAQVSAGIFYSLAVKTDGTLWAWGLNSSGQLGLGDITHRSSPVQVGSLTNWAQVSAGGSALNTCHSLAVKTDGTLWAWGLNSSGQLGLGDITHRSSPVQVGLLTNWAQVSAGREHSLAIKTDGTLWSWGRNTNVQLGLGDFTHRSSPVQVGSANIWKQVSGGYHSLAVTG